MSKSYQVSYIVTAFDKASATFKAIEKNLNRLDKSFDKVASRDQMRAKATIADSKNITDQKVKNLNNWAREENKAYKQSIIREKNTLRERVSALRAWEREESGAFRRSASRERTRIRNVNGASSMTNSAAIAVSAPAAAMTALSLKNTMTLEQAKLNLLTQFGKEGEKVFQEMYKYATETAFSLTEALDLTRRVEGGRAMGNLKFDSTEAMLQVTKNIGNVLLAYTGNAERMERALFQLSEIASQGYAVYGRDIARIMATGVPIYQALKSYTGMNKVQLEEKYGTQLPAQLLYDALDAWSKSDVVLRSIDLRSKSLAQSWDSLKESLFVFSGEYGKVLSETFGLTAKFKEIAGFLQQSTGEFQEQDDISTSLKKQALAFGAAWAITVPLLTAGSFAFQKMISSVGGGWVVGRRLLTMSGIMSGLYLTTVDWKTVIKDIDEDGLAGMIKHLDVVGASFLTILTTIGLINKGLKTAGFATLITAASASLIAALTALSAAPALVEHYADKKIKEGDRYKKNPKFRKMYDESKLTPNLDPLNPAASLFGNNDNFKMPNRLPDVNKPNTPNVIVNNTVNVDKNGNVAIETTKAYNPKNYSNKSETTGKKSPFSNPIIYDWQNDNR